MATYACSDLHGMMELYKQIKAFLKPEDKVYFLGDAGDRGPQSWELIKTIASDEQFIYMQGNHENMLTSAMREYMDYGYSGEELHLLGYNGGYLTFEGWLAEPEEIKKAWYSYLLKRPVFQEYVNTDGLRIMMTHAGFTPCYDSEDNICIPDDEDCIWDRHHFLDPWPVETENVIIVHGHTPIPYLVKRICWSDTKVEPGAFWYSGNHKVDIDNGCFATGVTCLLNLDTFDEEIFMTADVQLEDD